MQRRLIAAVAFTGCLFVACAPPADPQSAVPARLLVKPRAGVTLAELKALLPYGARQIGRIEQIDVYIFELAPGTNAPTVAAGLSKNPRIEFAEVDQKVPPSSRQRPSGQTP